jgi:hypothetical protein
MGPSWPQPGAQTPFLLGLLTMSTPRSVHNLFICLLYWWLIRPPRPRTNAGSYAVCRHILGWLVLQDIWASSALPACHFHLWPALGMPLWWCHRRWGSDGTLPLCPLNTARAGVTAQPGGIDTGRRSSGIQCLVCATLPGTHGPLKRAVLLDAPGRSCVPSASESLCAVVRYCQRIGRSLAQCCSLEQL